MAFKTSDLLSNEPLVTISQAEAEAGTATIDRLWTAERARQMHDARVTWDITDAQILHLKLNDDLPTTAVLDSSGSPVNDGILEGGRDTQDLSEVGKINDGFHFDPGNSDRVNVDTAVGDISSNTQGGSAIWYKPDIVAVGTFMLIVISDTDAHTWLGIFVGSGGKVFVVCDFEGVEQWRLETDAIELSVGNFSQILMNHNGIEASLFINNVKVNQGFTTDVDRTFFLNDMTGIDNLRIGSRNYLSLGNELFMDGVGDDVRILSGRPFTDDEREGLFNGGAGTEADSGTL